MEIFKEPLEIIVLLAAFGGIIYHVATVESKIYRSIDTTCDIAAEKIGYLEKQLELHLSEYRQQVLFNKELSQNFQQDINDKFERLYAILNDYKDMCKQISCLNKNKKNETST